MTCIDEKKKKWYCYYSFHIPLLNWWFIQYLSRMNLVPRLLKNDELIKWRWRPQDSSCLQELLFVVMFMFKRPLLFVSRIERVMCIVVIWSPRLLDCVDYLFKEHVLQLFTCSGLCGVSLDGTMFYDVCCVVLVHYDKFILVVAAYFLVMCCVVLVLLCLWCS
jgi:hypothetical protein